MEKKRITESYGRMSNNRKFDYTFWQQQSPAKIFSAAYDLICDYFILKEHNANEPRLQRTVESFQKI